jgi:CheY-like chemotaxis protein/anti-sigma regulatory factor (Ser/Thr protein kinase)
LTKLSQAHKMQAIGTLAGGIAHDFNNLLMPISGFAELLKLKSEAVNNVDFAGHCEQILVASNRARDLVRQILTFSRQSEVGEAPLQVSTLLKEAVKLLRMSITTSIDITCDIQTECDWILADPTELHQIIMNLCSNAAYAMRSHGGEISIALTPLKPQSVDGPRCETGYVCISVSDTGHGIPQAILQRVFDPFFTTKPQGEGTGMGLAVVHGIVSKLHGTIEIESTPKVGTQVRVYLPRIVHSPLPPISAAPVDADFTPLQVLYIDDEPMICSLALTALEDFGIGVSTQTSATDALALFEKDVSRFDAVVTDQGMPGMSGTAVIARIREISPETPTILCTGYSAFVNRDNAAAFGISEFLLKPVIFSEMAATIRRLVRTTNKNDTLP